MKALNKHQRAEHQSHFAAIEKAFSSAQNAVAELNAAIANWNCFREEVAEAMQGYFDARSETWQDGDHGIVYAAWIREWEDETDELEEPDFDFDAIALPHEVGGN